MASAEVPCFHELKKQCFKNYGILAVQSHMNCYYSNLNLQQKKAEIAYPYLALLEFLKLVSEIGKKRIQVQIMAVYLTCNS